VRGLLTMHGFEVTAEQDPLLQGTTLSTVFATRCR
jgi:hypothetical protein